MLAILKSIDNFFCQIEGKTQPKTLTGAGEQPEPSLSANDKPKTATPNAQQPKAKSQKPTAKTLPEVNAAFNAKLKEFEANGYKLKNRNDYFSCGYPTTSLVESGLNEAHEIIITQSVISKAIGLKKGKQDEAHSLTTDELIDFPNKLHSPVIVINGKTSDSRLAFVEILTPKRKTLVAIHFDFKGYRRVYTSIASIYSKDSSAVGLLLRQAEAKNEIWHVDPKKIKGWLSETGQLQLLPRIKANLSGTNIKQKKSKVKTLPPKKQTLGSILYNLFVSKEYKDQGLDGWREDKEKFKIDLINDIKTFLFTEWEKPWKSGLVFDDNGKILSGFRNISGRVYKNESNVMSLSSKSGDSPFFITLSKLNKLGGKIIDKLKTVWVISYIPIYKDKTLDEDAANPDFMLPKFHQVINVDFVEGIEKPTYKTVEFEKLELNEYVENFVNELKRLKRLPPLHYDQSDACFYRRSKVGWSNESIHLVPINSFKNINGYYSVLFHEITHSTANPKRCGRGKFKNDSLAYANEELVAEMGAMIICEELGLQYQRQNSLTYLNGWLKQAKGSDIDSALIEAYAYACDAADYLLEGINLDKLVPKTLAKRAGELDENSVPKTNLSANDKPKTATPENQQPVANNQKPKTKKPKQQTLTNPIDIFIHKAGSVYRGIPAPEIKALLGALERFKKTDDWERYKEDGILDLLELTESEAKTLGIPENYDSKKQPKTSLLTTQNYFGELKLSYVGEMIFTAYEKFASKKANLKPVNTGQLMLFGVNGDNDPLLSLNIAFNNDYHLFKESRLKKAFLTVANASKNAITETLISNGINGVVVVTPQTLARKIKKHKLSDQNITDLPFKLNYPLMISPYFDKRGQRGSGINVFVSDYNNEGLLMVGVKPDTKRNKMVVTEIATIHGKNDNQLVGYAKKATYINTKKIKELFSDPSINGEKFKKFLDFVNANIIQNFNNPTPTPNNLNGENKNLFGLQPISSTKRSKTYRLRGDLGQFLGEYDRNSYTIVLRGDKGAGKTRLLYQLINAFAGKMLKVAFLSLEIAKNSSITQRYKSEYISKANLKRIDITDQAPTYDDLNAICKTYDVVAIDSWTKLKGISQQDFDRLQKENPNTIIICIFQSTTGKITRGGNMPEYDAGTVIQVNKGGLAECEKNRYAPTDKIYDVFTKSLEPTEEPANV